MAHFRPEFERFSTFDILTHSFVDQRFLAEGDSWFTIGGIPIRNLLLALRFQRATLIVNAAQPGDTIRHMSQLAGNHNYRTALSDPSMQWDAILLSGGGNDLADHASALLEPKELRGPVDPADLDAYVVLRRLDALLERIREGYRRMTRLRDQSPRSSRAPIIVHTYDYITPRDASALGKGPWFFPVFVDEEVPEEFWQPLSRLILDRLAEAILSLAGELDNFHVVDTRGTLAPADLGSTANSKDWLNEIHPNAGGYAKLAQRIAPRLASLGVG
jgi:lysophospholipase L1-like esterase